MKQFLTTDTGGYTFSASAKTVTFTGVTLALRQILAIVNTTRNVVIYNPMATATGGTYTSPVLTLTYDTTAHANTDQLMIAIDVPGASIFPATFQRVTDEPHQVFLDSFDAALDTTNVWTAPTVGNSAVLAAVSLGVLSLGTGTTASGWSKLFSIGTFKLPIPAWMGYSFAITLPDGAAPTANAYRFWGAGTPATTPTTAAPLTDAVGFELTSAGKLVAVVYAGGTRTQIADLSSTGTNTQPLDANGHRYIVYVRTDKTYWYIDGLKTPVAESSFQSPQVQALPTCLLAIGGSTPPVTNTQIQCSGAAVWDTGKNAHQLADGTFPWRKATISTTGAISVQPEGNIAAGATDSGNPTKVGGVYNVTYPTLTDGQRGNLPVDSRGNLKVSLHGLGFPISLTSSPGDGFSEASSGIVVRPMPFVFNGISWDRQRGDTANGLDVDVTRLPSFPTGTNVIGKVSIDQTTPGTTNLVALAANQTVAQATGSNLHTVVDSGTITAVTAITNALPTGTNSIGTVLQAAITKGTQGSLGVTTQDLKDAGRVIVNAVTAIAGVTAVTTEALLALNVSRDGAATASVTTIAVTSGKRFRVTGLVVGLISTGATVLSGRLSLRLNPSGAVTATSTIICTAPISSGAALAQAGNELVIPIPDGIEFSGTMQIGVSQVCSAITGTVWASILGYEY